MDHASPASRLNPLPASMFVAIFVLGGYKVATGTMNHVQSGVASSDTILVMDKSRLIPPLPHILVAEGFFRVLG